MIVAHAPRRIELLQWFGLFGGAAAWTLQHLGIFAIAVARCNPGSARWGIDDQTWKLALTIAAGVVALAAEAAAVTTFLRTRDAGEDDPPPRGRLHFLSACASAGNVLFLGAILLDGIGSLYWHPCTQA
ncbi:MAG TPA: hypothetical protein VF101_04675 [Gaiellaceae bacterium]